MRTMLRTQELTINGRPVSKEGISVVHDPTDRTTSIVATEDDDTYYAHIDEAGMLELFNAPSNSLSLEERLTRDFGVRREARVSKPKKRTHRARTKKNRRRPKRQSFRTH